MEILAIHQALLILQCDLMFKMESEAMMYSL